MTLEERIANVEELRARAKELEEQAAAAQAVYEAADRELWDYMDAQGIQSIKIGKTNFVRASNIFGSVSDKQAFIDWAEEHQPELLQPAPRKGLINELVRQRLDNGEELPPGINWYPKDYVSRRAA